MTAGLLVLSLHGCSADSCGRAPENNAVDGKLGDADSDDVNSSDAAGRPDDAVDDPKEDVDAESGGDADSIIDIDDVESTDRCSFRDNSRRHTVRFAVLDENGNRASDLELGDQNMFRRKMHLFSQASESEGSENWRRWLRSGEWAGWRYKGRGLSTRSRRRSAPKRLIGRPLYPGLTRAMRWEGPGRRRMPRQVVDVAEQANYPTARPAAPRGLFRD